MGGVDHLGVIQSGTISIAVQTHCDLSRAT
jgi:hypothetical protein